MDRQSPHSSREAPAVAQTPSPPPSQRQQPLDVDTARILLYIKERGVPVNLILVGPPHIGKKHLARFMVTYLGARDPYEDPRSETARSIATWKAARNELDVLVPAGAQRHLDVGLDQKAAMHTREAIASIGARMSAYESEAKRRAAAAAAVAATASSADCGRTREPPSHQSSRKHRVPRDEPTSARTREPALPAPAAPSSARKSASATAAGVGGTDGPLDPRPCPNVRVFPGSSITDAYCRAMAMRTHKLMSRSEYALTLERVRRLHWQLENLSCPAHQTLYVYLRPDTDLYASKVHAYFDGILANRTPSEPRAGPESRDERSKRYVALCLEIFDKHEDFMASPDMVERFFTANVRFENDLASCDLACKHVCDVIVRHVAALVERGVWIAGPSPPPPSAPRAAGRANSSVYASIERTYVIPKIKFGPPQATHRGSLIRRGGGSGEGSSSAATRAAAAILTRTSSAPSLPVNKTSRSISPPKASPLTAAASSSASSSSSAPLARCPEVGQAGGSAAQPARRSQHPPRLDLSRITGEPAAGSARTPPDGLPQQQQQQQASRRPSSEPRREARGGGGESGDGRRLAMPDRPARQELLPRSSLPVSSESDESPESGSGSDSSSLSDSESDSGGHQDAHGDGTRHEAREMMGPRIIRASSRITPSEPAVDAHSRSSSLLPHVSASSILLRPDDSTDDDDDEGSAFSDVNL